MTSTIQTLGARPVLETEKGHPVQDGAEYGVDEERPASAAHSEPWSWVESERARGREGGGDRDAFVSVARARRLHDEHCGVATCCDGQTEIPIETHSRLCCRAKCPDKCLCCARCGSQGWVGTARGIQHPEHRVQQYICRAAGGDRRAPRGLMHPSFVSRRKIAVMRRQVPGLAHSSHSAATILDRPGARERDDPHRKAEK